MSTLNTDTILHIGSFMNPSDAVALTRVNKDVRANSDQLLRSQYQKTFGEINNIEQPDKKIMARLICRAEKQPNAAVNHNIYTVPSSRLERWKWIAGVENSLDKEAQEHYNSNINLLENSQATSIIQLKNQMKGFWHSDRQMKDYAQFKSKEQAQATSGLIIGKKLETRSRETFAKIGGFSLNNKNYDVAAFHILADEASVDQYRNYHDDTHRKFDSVSYGKTYIGIFEREQPHSLESLGLRGPNHNFHVHIGRDKIKPDWFEISSEGSIGNGKDAVFGSKRHLIIGNGLEYRDRTQDAQGSDRLLDQKLTQVMIEVTIQNKAIISLQVDSNHDDLAVLTAGGFESHSTEARIKELNDFRSEEGNKLFPPYRDYGSVKTTFETTDFTKKNVLYSRGAPEAWSDIIEREPILKPNAAILPEYWARKPNIVDG